MDKSKVLKKIKDGVKGEMSGEGTGHDWWHIQRVLRNALAIAKKEKGADNFIVQLAALTHDLDDWKFRKEKRFDVKKFLTKNGVSKEDINKVLEIVENLSFKMGTNRYKLKTLEGKIVQDADRLDALGAIGIARLFAFGGKVGREIHNPDKKFKEYKSLNNLKWSTNTSLSHFYEKILLLHSKMHTKTGQKIALGRHKYIQNYLKQFYAEWDGLR